MAAPHCTKQEQSLVFLRFTPKVSTIRARNKWKGGTGKFRHRPSENLWNQGV